MVHMLDRSVDKFSEKHAIYAPSNAKRWFSCPGSIQATSHIRDGDNEHGLEGTAMHALLEGMLSHNIEAEHYQGAAFKVTGADAKGRAIVHILDIGAEEVRCADMMRTAIERYERRPEVSHLSARILEKKLDGTHIDPQLFGTCDYFQLFTLENSVNEMNGFDYKHGFLDVDVSGNHQLFIYFVMMLYDLQQTGRRLPDVCRMGIVQPRSIAVGPRVKMVEVATAQVLQFEPMLRQAIARTKEQKAPLVAGSHCQFCPGLGLCAATASALNGLATLLTSELPAASDAALAKLFHNRKLVEAIFKRADAILLSRMLNGAAPEGLKLVTSSKHQKWRDEAAVKAEIIAKIGPAALDPPTPSQLEKLGGEAKAIAARHAILPPGDATIAPVGDKRAAFVPKSPVEVFGPPVT